MLDGAKAVILAAKYKVPVQDLLSFELPIVQNNYDSSTGNSNNYCVVNMEDKEMIAYLKEKVKELEDKCGKLEEANFKLIDKMT